ncbi:MAG: LLM class flavin-dependent oxidoreductase [Novosphingobium sp.]
MPVVPEFPAVASTTARWPASRLASNGANPFFIYSTHCNVYRAFQRNDVRGNLMRTTPLRAGMFVAPFHATDESPTLCFERDLQLAEYADSLGFAEFWFGEHHSGSYENSASPELMIAAAASRTKRIKLGTGVVSLPYHNPLMTANRIAQLDHLTFGRLIFGAGPGLLVSDAYMLGLDARESRDKLERGLSVITRLLQGEWVTESFDGWYDLRDAHAQVLPMNHAMEICVASTFSPNGGSLAAKFGAGMLCLASTLHGGYDALTANWKIACDQASKLGRNMNPADVRCATDIHIAETRDKAMDQVREGYESWLLYIKNQSEQLKESPAHLTLEELIDGNQIVVGTPDDAIEQIHRLEQKVPDFGCLLLLDKNWSSTEHKKRSMEMLMRYVLPSINGDNRNRQKSFDWARANRDGFIEVIQSANERAFAKHARQDAEGTASASAGAPGEHHPVEQLKLGA